ncbi:uracil-DNA glycosylase family protein [Singulisphaera sp. PoT]|uniref:uracil-DNA glycosylase family protein n=1 Tax=Singulisphaera sp. PoT TaxID=3411797 RepID=UPI003BF49674
MPSLEKLIEAIQNEAIREPFPVDTSVYEAAEKDPNAPILYAGSLDSPVCVFARDLGKDEVAAGQPLIGAGGRLVRTGVYVAEFGKVPPKSDKKLESVLDHILLTNTVPYKPPGNKAYTNAVKERFRPFIAAFLAGFWKGNSILTLGTEAFEWFEPYADPKEIAAFWEREDRYESEFECNLKANVEGAAVEKRVTLMPLPHPSPLNRRWYPKFPELLEKRLSGAKKKAS